MWIDTYVLTVGDSLRREIDRGIASCAFGVVILSPSFFEKNWPQAELDGLATLENARGSKVILPVRHSISIGEIRSISPLLAGKFMVSTADGLDEVAANISRAVLKTLPADVSRTFHSFVSENHDLEITESGNSSGKDRIVTPLVNPSEIRIKRLDGMPTETHEWLPRFYREQDRYKQPLSSSVIAFVVEVLNRGSRTVAVDKLRLRVMIGTDSLETDEVFREGCLVSGGMSCRLSLSHLRHASLAPGVPQFHRIAFRLSRTLPADLKTVTALLELTDSDDRRHTSEWFCVYEYQGYMLTRQMADQLYGREGDD